MNLQIACASNSVPYVQNSVGIDVCCEIEKSFCLLYLAADLYCAHEAAFFSLADKDVVFHSAILWKRRLALIEKGVVRSRGI
jgi:hypothetical protein